MKKFLLTVAAAVVAVACGGNAGETSLEKALVGDYKAEISLPNTSGDEAAAQMAAAILSQIEMEMNFKANGTVDMTSSMGGKSETSEGKWEVKADSLFITDDTQTKGFQLVKTDDGFKLINDEMGFILTQKED